MKLGALLFVAAIACSSKSSDDSSKGSGEVPKMDEMPSGTESNEQLEARGMALLAELTKLIVEAGADCSKLATRINAYADKNKDLLTRLKELEKRITPVEKQAMKKRQKSQIESLALGTTEGLKACSNDPDVRSAFARIAE